MTMLGLFVHSLILSTITDSLSDISMTQLARIDVSFVQDVRKTNAKRATSKIPLNTISSDLLDILYLVVYCAAA